MKPMTPWPRAGSICSAAAALALSACGDPQPTCDPNAGLPPTLSFAEHCEPHLGVMPEIDCSEGVLVPLTQDGEAVWQPRDDFDCDNHSMQHGQCMPGATVVRKTGQDRRGDVLDHVVWLGFCRPEPSEEDPQAVVPNIDIIGYNAITGATCMLATDEGVPHDASGTAPWTSQGVMPSSTDPRFEELVELERTEECAECHHAGPFIHNDWIDGARMPDDPDEPVVPIVSGPNAPYWLVGTAHGRLATPHIDGNGCVSCHRFPSRTLELFQSNGWVAAEHMPPHDPGSLSGDYEAMLACVESGPENTPGCEWVVPAAGACEGERLR